MPCPDVQAAEGSVSGEAQLIDQNGKAIVFGGAPNLGFSISSGDSPFNVLTLVNGAWPRGSEVVIDNSTASKKHLVVGGNVGVQAEGPVEQFRISGIVKFGSASALGGATLAGFDLPTAQTLFQKHGRFDEIAVVAEAGRDGREPGQPDQVDPPADRAGAHRHGAGRRGRQADRLVHLASCAASCSRSAASRSSSAAS